MFSTLDSMRGERPGALHSHTCRLGLSNSRNCAPLDQNKRPELRKQVLDGWKVCYTQIPVLRVVGILSQITNSDLRNPTLHVAVFGRILVTCVSNLCPSDAIECSKPIEGAEQHTNAELNAKR
jgi:hypothetical protein